MSFVRTYVRLRRATSWVDLFVFAGIAALLFGMLSVGKEWSGERCLTFSFGLFAIPPANSIS
ncbi:MAG: hypothetical protein KGJ59_07535 [Bacteroidota bacterium]|nr:hypothetical protein [Bacteroidota bacterium]